MPCIDHKNYVNLVACKLQVVTTHFESGIFLQVKIKNLSTIPFFAFYFDVHGWEMHQHRRHRIQFLRV